MTLRFGRYETINQIATGGMATVYLGRAVGVGGFERKIAIKVMHEHIADDPDFITMFLDEARLAARIHHPNVVGTIDVQRTPEAIFLVMDYVEGASLRGVLRALRKKGQSMPTAITIRVLLDTLAGLHAAHELKAANSDELLNLVHRDVSPHNIMIGTDGIARITDFGVARAEARLSTTRGGTLKGKIAYMPPEQGRGDPIDRRADVYAAGVVLWEMLTNRRLFSADHDGALIAMILRGTDMRPDEVNPEVPEAIADVCMQALSVDTAWRFATAADFADALENAAADSGMRVAKARDIARFVDEYKVTIDTKRPPPPSESSQSGSFEFDPHSHPSATIPSAPSLPTSSVPTGSQQTGTSQLTGIGAVHSITTPSRDKKMLIAGLGIGALAVLAVVTVMGMRADEPHEAPAAAPEQAQLPPEPPPPETTAPPETPAVEVAMPETTPSAEVSSTPAAKADPVRQPRYPKVRPKGKGPLGFEPDDL